MKAIPLSELGMPRVDVLVTISGIFRETFPQCTVLIDRAFRVTLAASYNTLLVEINNDPMAQQLTTALNSAMATIQKASLFVPGNDPVEMNHIAQHWLEDTKKLLQAGAPAEEAGIMAISRIFGPSIGEWGAKSVREGPQLAWTWNDRLELADYYIHDMQYAYREDNQGTPLGEVFTMRLADVEGIYHSRSTNVRGILDLDHNYEFLGGFSIAVEKVSGKAPQLFILNQIDASKPQVETLSKFINRDLQTKLFNPQWIIEMMKQGPAGASYIASQFIDNMVGWDVLRPDAITDEMWNSVIDVYLKDKYNLGVTEWLSTGNNAYAMIDISGKLLTMAHKGFWQADEATIRQIANTWANLIAQQGVACCDCSCGNIAMMQWATQFINPNILAQFNAQIYQATKNSMFAPPTPPTPTEPKFPATPEIPTTPEEPSTPATPGQPTAPTTPGTEVSPAPTSSGMEVSAAEVQVSSAGPAKAGQGKKAYEVTKVTPPSSSAGGIPIWALLGVVLLTGLAILGYFKGSILGFILRR